jgi:hypothetical protein
MQDTNATNTISSTPSSLQKEKAAPVSPPVIQVRSVVPESANTQPDLTVVQKILAFISNIFSGNRWKKRKAVQVIEIVVQEQKAAIPAVEEQVQKLLSAVTSAPAAKIQGSVIPENTLRKIAERQFLNMDISQATRN